MFENESKKYTNNVLKDVNCTLGNPRARHINLLDVEEAYQEGVIFGYNKAIEWFDAKSYIPFPKKLEMYRYTVESISDKGDIVCWDYKDKAWKKIVIENNKVTYIPVEIEKWCNKPRVEV